MVTSFLYLALRKLIELVAPRPRSAEYKELEIVVLRHELSIGARWRGRPSGQPIVPFWLPQAGCCRVGAGLFSSSLRRLCFFGIADRRHLERVLRTFVDHYNGHRPHCGLGLAAPARTNVVPLPSGVSNIEGVSRRGRLGGLINEYRAAA